MKKILAIFLSVLLVCAAMPFAFATAAEEATIVVSDVEGKAGDTVSVTVSIKNNPGIISARLRLGYDADALELVEAVNGDFASAGYSYGEVENNPFAINWCLATLKVDDTSELLTTLTFKIKDGAAAGEYPLTLTILDPEDFYNVAWDTVEFALDNGSVTVVDDAPIVPDEPVFTEPTIVVSDAEGEAGDTINVTVSIKNNPGIISARLRLGYDANALELVEAVNGDFASAGYSYGEVENNPFAINWCLATLKVDDTSELLTTLTFKIKDGAAAGEYPLTLIILDPEDFYNVAWDTVEFALADGSVTVIGAAAPCEHSYESACDPICDLCGESRPVHTEGIIHFDAVDAGCHYIGNIEYWFCPECEMFWADEALTQVTNSKNVIVPALGGEVAHIEAVAPGCHYNGNIEYWVCYECEQVWQDEALTQLTNSKNVILPAIGGEVEHVEAKDPTCSSEGNIEYWFCAQCEQYWQDEALTQLTNSKNVKIGLADHNIVHFDAVEPGCHYIGNIEYWFCTECEIFWADEALTQITNSKSVILPAKGGEVIHFDAVAPGCHYIGNIEYWFCAECEQFWQDEALTQITNSKNVILPALESTATYVPAKAPTCYEGGNVEYWFCDKCEQVWANEALTQLTNIKNVQLAPIEHANLVHMDAVQPGCHYIGNIEYWVCYDCETVWADKDLTQITNIKNVILPALKDSADYVAAKDATCSAEGNVEYWFCAECEQVWVDEALTQLSNLKNVIIGKLDHTYDYPCDPDCNVCGENREIGGGAGSSADYNMSDYKIEGQLGGGEAIRDLDDKLNFTITSGWFTTQARIYKNGFGIFASTEGISSMKLNMGYKASTFDVFTSNDGENWTLAYDNHPMTKDYTDVTLEFATPVKYVKFDASMAQIRIVSMTVNYAGGGNGHNMVHKEAVAPSCTENGNIEHWYCADCGMAWLDEACTLNTNLKAVVLGATCATNAQHVDAVEAGCHFVGNIEYWYCANCDVFYSDAACTEITNYLSTIIPAKGGDVAHIEAVAPGCHYIGNIEYWYCSDCEQFWQDEALTQLTNSKNVLLPALESTATYVPAVDPTCESEGNVEYWFCDKCEQVWVDEALTQLSNLKNVKLGVLDHNIVHMDAVEAGCHYIGNIEYWFCSNCGAHWQDEALTQVTNSKNVIVPAKGGDVAHIEAVAPGCHYIGNIEYWYCPECEQFWQDEALTQLTNSKNVILPATGSDKLEHVEAKDPTCLEAGNVEYWFCAECEQVWVNEALTQLSNLKNVVIAPVDHNIVHIEAVEPGCHYIGNIEYWYCSVCGTHWQDEALTQITNSKNVIVPAKGGDVIAFEAIEPGCHYNGRIAYWYCAECDQFWADEALTQLTNSKNVILPATGSDKLQHVEYKAPTATENGNVEYWYCAECEQVWTNEALTQLSNLKSVIIPATGEVEEPETPDSPVTGDSTVAVVVALLTLIASGVAVVVLKNKKHA